MALTIPASMAVIIFFGGMLHASITDLRHRRIANWTVIALLVAWFPVALIADLPGSAMLGSMSAAVLVFVLGFVCFCLGLLGGGDVKLAAIAVLWLGAPMAPAFLMLSAIFGALIALVFLGIAKLKRRGGNDVQTDALMLPYGPGLASAAVVLFGQSQWFMQVH